MQENVEGEMHKQSKTIGIEMKKRADIPMNHYLGSVLLSPDQSTIVYHTNRIGIYNLTRMFYLSIIPYSLDWYPFMSITDPATCCFIASSKGRPVQLFDSGLGTLRHTYITKDHSDEIQAPLTVKFNLLGSKIYCGFESRVLIFDIHGELLDEVKTSPFRKSKEGLKGLISSIGFNPDQSGIYALGTYQGMIGLYDERNNEEFCTFYSNQITQVQFSPDGKYLLSTGRKSNEICVWDIRNSGDVLYKLKRPGLTTQRITFDVLNDFLVTGGTDGLVRFYDYKNGNLAQEWKVSDATVGCCSIDPSLLVTGSGHREFPLDDDPIVGDSKLSLFTL